MKKKIINNRTGASLITVILVLSLVSALAMFVSSQIINQIKSTSKRTDEIQLQYTSEAGIERTIEELLSQINSSGNIYSVSFSEFRNSQSSYLDLIQQEIEGIGRKIDSVDTHELEKAIDDIDYTSDIDSIISKLRNVRTELLNIVKDNTSQRSEIKEIVDFNISKVCKAIDYANTEKNKNIEPIEYIDMSDPDGFQVYRKNLDKIIGSDKNAYGNTLALMWNYINDDNNGILGRINKLHGFVKNSNKIDPEAKEIYELVELCNNMANIIGGLHSEMNSKYSPIFGVYGPNKDKQKEILEKAEEKLRELEVTIDTLIISARESREEVYKLYIDYMEKNYFKIEDKTEDEFKKRIDEILKMYDSIEDQLRWFKKKINLFDSNDDSIDGPNTEVPDSDTDVGDIKLIGYTDEFEVMNLTYKYEVKYEIEDGKLVDEITLPIKNQKLKQYNLNIVSNATNNKKTYKTRATININLENGIQCSVDEYEHIN